MPEFVVVKELSPAVEGQRLVRSAPRLHFGIADCWRLVQGLDHVAKGDRTQAPASQEILPWATSSWDTLTIEATLAGSTEYFAAAQRR